MLGRHQRTVLTELGRSKRTPQWGYGWILGRVDFKLPIKRDLPVASLGIDRVVELILDDMAEAEGAVRGQEVAGWNSMCFTKIQNAVSFSGMKTSPYYINAETHHTVSHWSANSLWRELSNGQDTIARFRDGKRRFRTTWAVCLGSHITRIAVVEWRFKSCAFFSRRPGEEIYTCVRGENRELQYKASMEETLQCSQDQLRGISYCVVQSTFLMHCGTMVQKPLYLIVVSIHEHVLISRRRRYNSSPVIECLECVMHNFD